MISMTRFGMILAFSMLLWSCNENSSETKSYNDMMKTVHITQYSDSAIEYSIDADSLLKKADTVFLSDVIYKRRTDDSEIVLQADCMTQLGSSMKFEGHIDIWLKDSMRINTNCIFVDSDSDFVYTYDSVFIYKHNSRMRTRSFITDMNFSEIIFNNPVVVIDED